MDLKTLLIVLNYIYNTRKNTEISHIHNADKKSSSNRNYVHNFFNDYLIENGKDFHK